MIRVPPLALPLLSQLALCRRRMSTSCDESVSRHYPMSPWGKTTPAESHGGGGLLGDRVMGRKDFQGRNLAPASWCQPSRQHSQGSPPLYRWPAGIPLAASFRPDPENMAPTRQGSARSSSCGH